MSDVPRAAQYTFMGAAFFALVGIGFFAFVFFWKPSSTQVTLQPAPQDDMRAGYVGPSPVVPERTAEIQYAPSQADPNDARAEAKLRALDALNSN